MVSLLLMLSFLLHIISFIAYVNLLRQLKLKQESNEEIEQLFTTYLDDIKRENDRLQMLLLKQDEELETPHNVINYSRKDVIKQKEKNTQSTQLNEVNRTNQDIEVGENKQDTIEAAALQLYEDGYSITDIAQYLNRGKTEISLIIELNEREKIIDY